MFGLVLIKNRLDIILVFQIQMMEMEVVIMLYSSKPRLFQIDATIIVWVVDADNLISPRQQCFR